MCLFAVTHSRHHRAEHANIGFTLRVYNQAPRTPPQNCFRTFRQIFRSHDKCVGTSEPHSGWVFWLYCSIYSILQAWGDATGSQLPPKSGR